MTDYAIVIDLALEEGEQNIDRAVSALISDLRAAFPGVPFTIVWWGESRPTTVQIEWCGIPPFAVVEPVVAPHAYREDGKQDAEFIEAVIKHWRALGVNERFSESANASDILAIAKAVYCEMNRSQEAEEVAEENFPPKRDDGLCSPFALTMAESILLETALRVRDIVGPYGDADRARQQRELHELALGRYRSDFLHDRDARARYRRLKRRERLIDDAATMLVRELRSDDDEPIARAEVDRIRARLITAIGHSLDHAND